MVIDFVISSNAFYMLLILTMPKYKNSYSNDIFSIFLK